MPLPVQNRRSGMLSASIWQFNRALRAWIGGARVIGKLFACASLPALTTAADPTLAPEPLPPPPNPAAKRPVPEAAIVQLPDGRVQVGKIQIDRHARSITFPAEINANTGIVEYFLVTRTGKIHESVLSTEVAPYHVHLAMLLLGARAASDADMALFSSPGKRPPGDDIQIEVAWKNGDLAVKKAAEELVKDSTTGKEMSRSGWVYNGSRFQDGTFLAQQQGSIVSLITDPGALANNPQEGRADDENWSLNASDLPAVKTPVDVTIRLLPGAPPSGDDASPSEPRAASSQDPQDHKATPSANR